MSARKRRRAQPDRRTVRVPLAKFLDIEEVKELHDQVVAEGYMPPDNAVVRLNKRSWTLSIKWKGSAATRSLSRSLTLRGLPLP